MGSGLRAKASGSQACSEQLKVDNDLCTPYSKCSGMVGDGWLAHRQLSCYQGLTIRKTSSILAPS